MFQIGKAVIHHLHGLGYVEGIEEKRSSAKVSFSPWSNSKTFKSWLIRTLGRALCAQRFQRKR